MPRQIVVLGTGGTIAGAAVDAADHIGYQAGQLNVAQLLAALPELAHQDLRVEQLAQLDSKDMDFATWHRLATRCQQLQDDPSVAGIVITHGTDTLEETAYLLQRVLRGSKPVVMTAAMRPASSRSPDGPQNLLDAVMVAGSPDVQGVLVLLQGAVHAAERVRKVHSYRVDAFASEAGPLAWVENGALRSLAPWPAPGGLGVERLAQALWPRVELLWNAVGADGALVSLLQALAQQEGRRLGLVVAGTGNGSLSTALEAVLLQAQQQGVAVLRCTRCAAGPVIGGTLPTAGALSPPQARVELLLQLLA
jgi:L-asparaginase